jgi:hypothetical protein
MLGDHGLRGSEAFLADRDTRDVVEVFAADAAFIGQ